MTPRQNDLVRVRYTHFEHGKEERRLSGLMARHQADKLVIKLESDSRNPEIVKSEDYEH